MAIYTRFTENRREMEIRPKKKSIFLTVKQLQKNSFNFHWNSNTSCVRKIELETLSVSKQNQQFSIPVKEKPKLYLDPKTSLLFEGSASMTK